jgi:glycosyltransferase involved in cell wall biosynthesis
MNYSVGIVTYIERFDRWFKPLLKTIKSHKPDVEIIVCINGEHKKPFDETYRREMLLFLSQYTNVYPMFFTAHRSLSKLWNNLLINATNDIVVRMDDDITIANDYFWKQIEIALQQSNYRSFKINSSWSHTVLNRLEVEKVGWFDERLLAGGEEDGDFEWRYGNFFGREFLSMGGFNIINHWNQVNYDKCLVNLKKCDGKRSQFNKEFVGKKYRAEQSGETHGIMTIDGEAKLTCVLPTLNQYPYEKFCWENKEKL